MTAFKSLPIFFALAKLILNSFTCSQKLNTGEDVMYNVKYVGCFSVWSELRTQTLERVEPSSVSKAHMEDISVCASKCLHKYLDNRTALAFIRGMDCRCAPNYDKKYLGNELDLNNCAIECSNRNSFSNHDEVYFCGGNQGYSVYYVELTQSPERCKMTNFFKRVPNTRITKIVDLPSKLDTEICPIEHIACAICQFGSNVCTPQKLSPYYDYFPLNSPRHCAKFCGVDLLYFDTLENSVKQRKATTGALLLWWNSSDNEKLPICFCTETLDLPAFPGHCTYKCPGGDPNEPCGGISERGEHVYVSVYNIESSSECQTPPSACPKQCIQQDRYGYLWHATCNQTATSLCSNLIPASEGKAYWKCAGEGKFDSPDPDVSNCKSTWVEKMQEKLSRVNTTIMAKKLGLQLFDGCHAPLTQIESTRSRYFGHEMRDLCFLGRELVGVAGENLRPSLHEFENLVNLAVELNACLLKSTDPWRDLPFTEKLLVANYIANSTEDVLFYLTCFAKQTNYRKVFYPLEKFVALAEIFDKTNTSSVPHVFPNDFPIEQDSTIILPIGWTDLFVGTRIETIFMSISPSILAEILGDDIIYGVNGPLNTIINGQILSLSIASSNESHSFWDTRRTLKENMSKHLHFPENGVEIVYRHKFDAWGEKVYDIPRKLHNKEKPKVSKGGAQCVFWDAKALAWSSDGCKVVKSNRTITICECSHLSAFTVLMDVHRYVGKEVGLEILTLVLCGLSTLALFVTIVMLSFFKSGICEVRATIRKHISFCLIVGNGMISIVLDKHYFYRSEGVCIGVAIMAHYIFLCAFMWMLLEGIQMFRRVVLVFDSGKSHMKILWIMGYGIPILPITMTAAIGHINGEVPYGGEEYCWLLGNYAWAFMGPIAVVMMVNTVIMVIVLKIACKLEHQRLRDELSLGVANKKLGFYRLYFTGCFSLTVVLGITWTVGYFILVEGPTKTIASYLFTILNASQGFLMFLLACRACVRNF